MNISDEIKSELQSSDSYRLSDSERGPGYYVLLPLVLFCGIVFAVFYYSILTEFSFYYLILLIPYPFIVFRIWRFKNAWLEGDRLRLTRLNITSYIDFADIESVRYRAPGNPIFIGSRRGSPIKIRLKKEAFGSMSVLIDPYDQPFGAKRRRFRIIDILEYKIEQYRKIQTEGD